jgi:hypothetical protein
MPKISEKTLQKKELTYPDFMISTKL